jgi:hypothetical protein
MQHRSHVKAINLNYKFAAVCQLCKEERYFNNLNHFNVALPVRIPIFKQTISQPWFGVNERLVECDYISPEE